VICSLIDRSHIFGVTSVLNHGMLGLEIVLRGGEFGNPYLSEFRRFLKRGTFYMQEGLFPESDNFLEMWRERITKMKTRLDDIEHILESDSEINKPVRSLMALVEIYISEAFMNI
jgi:hypothetical protein